MMTTMMRGRVFLVLLLSCSKMESARGGRLPKANLCFALSLVLSGLHVGMGSEAQTNTYEKLWDGMCRPAAGNGCEDTGECHKESKETSLAKCKEACDSTNGCTGIALRCSFEV